MKKRIPQKKKKTKLVNFRLTPEEHEKLVKACRKNHTTITIVIKRGISEFMPGIFE